jgi:Zn-finger protein
MANYSFFQNKACEYFPCHEKGDPENFNCLFCYCPLYALGDRCGGAFTYTENGIKDCSGCMRPHRRDSFESIMKHMPDLLELAKKP